MNRTPLSPPTPATSSAEGAEKPEEEFWRLCESGRRPELGDFIMQRHVDMQGLRELVRLDQRDRWQRTRGDWPPPAAESYLQDYPDLAAEPNSAFEVIYHEFLLREALGHAPQADEFAHRFPEHAERLRMQLQLHAALAEKLPASDDTADSLQGTSIGDASTRGRSDRSLPRVSGYELLGLIGHGGMGVVYRARQLALNRLVALKMIRAAEFARADMLARFRAEAEVVARLHHPQIVQIFDYGEHDGLSYLALELVEGGTLAARLNGTPWPARQAAALVAELAKTVAYAHSRGVIHRDLKPANVLVESKGQETGDCEQNGSRMTPDASPLTPGIKIADFGLAKIFRDDAAEHTQTGAILGTPSYMAPEQAAAQASQIGPASDVYSLGAILYELLTGRPPFQANTALETLQQVVGQEPVSLWRLQPRIPADLATVCAKCLSKEPQRRYGSAAALAADLERFLTDRPILARPIGKLQRGWRWCRRNPVVACLTGSVLALIVIVAAVSTVLSVRLSAQLERTGRAEAAERNARQSAQLRLFEAYLAEATANNSTRRIGQRFGTLATVDQANAVLDEVGRTSDRILRLRNATIAALAHPDLRRLRRLSGWPADGSGLAFSAAADRYLASTQSGNLFVYRLSDGEQLLRLDHSESAGATISPDGKYVAAVDRKGAKIWRIDPLPAAVVWEELGASCVTLSPDSRQAVLSGMDGRMHLLNLATASKVRALGRGAARFYCAFDAAQQRVAVCGSDSIQIISLATGDVLSELTRPPADTAYPCVAWHPSGEYLAATGYENGVTLWHVASQKQVRTYPHTGVSVQCFFAGAGDQLLTHNTWSNRLHLWQTATQRELLADPTFFNFVNDVNLTGQHLLLVREDAGPALWELEPGSEMVALPHGLERSLGAARSAAISPDGRLLAIGREDGLELWDLLARRRVVAHELSRRVFARFAADGSLVVGCDAGIYRWPRQELQAPVEHALAGSTAGLGVRFGPAARLHGPTWENKFAMTSTADRLVVQDRSGWLVAGADSRESAVRIGPQVDPRTVSLSADGRWVALGSWDHGGASVYESQSGRRLADLPVGPNADVLFSPDARWLATSPDGLELWRTGDWSPGPKLRARGSTPGGMGVAFSPDSRVLAVGQPTGETRLVDPASGSDWATLVHPDRVGGQFLVFSPDQTRLILHGPGADAAPQVWNLAAIRRELARRRLDWSADVLRPKTAIAADAATITPLTVVLDEGDLPRQLEAQELIRQAGAAQTALARDLLRQALVLDPEHVTAHNNLAWTLATGPIHLRDSAAAVEHARRAVDLGGEQHLTLNTLGVALYRDERHAEGIQVLQRSLALSPPEESPFDLIFLALCHAGLGESSPAKGFLARAEAAIQSHRGSLTPPTMAELSRFVEEARRAIADQREFRE